MKPKLVAIRPSELVILAIHNLGEKSGSSEKEIIRFISRKYGLDEDHLTPRVEAALRRGLNFGILSFRNGRYGLEDVPEPPTKGMDGNVEDGRCGKKGDEKGGSRMSRKRDRSEITEKISEIIEREIHQFKKAKGFGGGDTCAKTGRPILMNAEDNPTETKQQEQPTVSHPEQPDKNIVKPKKARAPPKARRKAAPRTRKPRATRKLVGRGQKKPAARGRPARGKPRGRPPKKNVGGGGGGALKSIAKVFGMRSGQKPPSKPRTRSKAPPAGDKGKKKPSEKSCPKACPRTCPNAVRQRQQYSKSKDRMDVKSTHSTDKSKSQAKTLLHQCEKMRY